MEKLTIITFNGNDYISQKDLLKFLAEISDAVNTFSDRGDPIRAEGANKVINLLLEKIEPPQEYWKPSKEYGKNKDFSDCLTELACELYECHDESDSPEDTSIKEYQVLEKWEPILLKKAQIWKPSEEQMEALKDAVRLFKETHFEKFHYKIESLYEQLLKLGVKEEPEY